MSEIHFNKELGSKLKLYSKREEIIKKRNFILEYLNKTIKDKRIFGSIMKYWEMIKNLEISGDVEEGD